MAKKIYLSQIQAKIDLTERERKQVLEYLKLDKLRAAIEVMNDKTLSNADTYNTKLYTYKTYKRSFNGKLRQLFLAELKAEPNRCFTVNELIKLVLIKCG